MKDDILLVGTGALATLFAARLGGAGHPVHMLGTWKQGVQSLQANGARVVDADGKVTACDVHATDDPHEVKNIRHAVVLVKSWQTERAALQLKQCLPKNGLALTLQNGLGNHEILARHLGPAHTALGTVTTGVTLLEPGLVRTAGEGTIALERDPALGPLQGAFQSCGFQVRVVDDARSLVWGKLVINAAINPLTALLGIPNGELLALPAAGRMMRALATEAAAVATAEGVDLPFTDPIGAAEDVARRTAANYSSMFQDLKRGSQTEIDAICGAVVEHGEAHDISTPYNLACWRLVRHASANQMLA